MRGAVAWAGSVLTLGACLHASFPAVSAGGLPAPGSAAIVGALSLVPPIEGARAWGASDAEAYAVFTRDLQEPFGAALWRDRLRHDSAWVSIDGAFYIEIRTGGPLYLRGLVLDNGRSEIETPVEIDLCAAGPVLYVGHLFVNRTPPFGVLVRDDFEGARSQAVRSGRATLARKPWVRCLARPIRS